MILILRDFKPLFDLVLYSEHMPDERITWSKIGLNTYTPIYTRVYTVDELSI